MGEFTKNSRFPFKILHMIRKQLKSGPWIFARGNNMI